MFPIGKRHSAIIKFLIAEPEVLDPRMQLLVLMLVRSSAGCGTDDLTPLAAQPGEQHHEAIGASIAIFSSPAAYSFF